MSPARTTTKTKSKASPAKAQARNKPKTKQAKPARGQARSQPPSRTKAKGRSQGARSQSGRGQPKARIFDLLRDEHRMAMEMLEQICEGGMGEEERLEQFAEFRAMLMGHSLAEARAFYAPLKQAADDPEKVLEADVEHLVVERLLEDLSGGLLEEEQWMARAKVLKELIRHHVQEEEGELFRLAQQSCDADELEHMADDFESERGRLVEAVA
jgi:hemerythrin-like domain-containing protein